MNGPNALPAFLVTLGGLALIAAYAVLGALQILVLNPLAAAPGLTLPEIHAAVEVAGESLSPLGPIVFVVSGLTIGAAIAAYAYAAPAPASPALVASGYLVVLALGAPAYFAASFSAGMSLADTFAISGGDHSGWSAVLFWVSGTALVTLPVLGAAIALSRGGRRPRQAPTA